jgi:hypothetical protein
MVAATPFRRPQPKILSRGEFLSIAREMVGAGNIAVLRHLNRDHPERAINQAQIERCIEKGTVQTNPFVNQYGNFQADIFRHMAGHQLTVVAAIEWERRVLVITAF